jgi:hypothetical protein
MLEERGHVTAWVRQQLFHKSGYRMMVVRVETSAALTAGTPRVGLKQKRRSVRFRCVEQDWKHAPAGPSGSSATRVTTSSDEHFTGIDAKRTREAHSTTQAAS